jgi:putative transposase
MPIRLDPLYTGEVYHVYNRTIDGKLIFADEKNCHEFINTLLYYRSSRSIMRFSYFKQLQQNIFYTLWKKILRRKYFKVEILSYCLLPNHYHFLLRQIHDKGIESFISNSTNSITRYFNILHKRKGPIFLPRFQGKRIYTDEQLIYVSRYIHTNPYAANIISRIDEIFQYPYSSIAAYIKDLNPMKIETKTVLERFNKKKYKYKSFIKRNAEDQKMKEITKYINRLF